MAIEMSSDSPICFKCGRKFGKRRGVFPVSYAVMHKGVGTLPICRDCTEAMYNQYLSQCKDPKLAIRQMCRKLDLYWSDDVYNAAALKSAGRSLMTQYLTKVNTVAYAGKSYDDTLEDEQSLWKFTSNIKNGEEGVASVAGSVAGGDESDEVIAEYMQELSEFKVTKDIISFWGTGYTKQMYAELEQRRAHWMSMFPDGVAPDISTEEIIRQICSLELDINRDRAEGKSVEKNVNALNTLLGSANLKPAQREKSSDSGDEKVPFGVWIRRFENEKPIPKPDPELEDVDGIRKYVLVWVYGHLMKMLGGGKENAYSKLYEEEIERLRVDKPEYADEEDDEEFLYDVFSDKEDDDIGGDAL